MSVQVWEDILKHDIHVHRFAIEDDDDETLPGDASSQIPIFAVSASTGHITAGGKTLRGRTYPWGYVDGILSVLQLCVPGLFLTVSHAVHWLKFSVDNPQHSDFSRLRDFLTRCVLCCEYFLAAIASLRPRTHTQELIDSTGGVHYEAFRTARLEEVAANADNGDSASSSSVMSRIEHEKVWFGLICISCYCRC